MRPATSGSQLAVVGAAVVSPSVATALAAAVASARWAAVVLPDVDAAWLCDEGQSCGRVELVSLSI